MTPNIEKLKGYAEKHGIEVNWEFYENQVIWHVVLTEGQHRSVSADSSLEKALMKAFIVHKYPTIIFD